MYAHPALSSMGLRSAMAKSSAGSPVTEGTRGCGSSSCFLPVFRGLFPVGAAAGAAAAASAALSVLSSAFFLRDAAGALSWAAREEDASTCALAEVLRVLGASLSTERNREKKKRKKRDGFLSFSLSLSLSLMLNEKKK